MIFVCVYFSSGTPGRTSQTITSGSIKQRQLTSSSFLVHSVWIPAASLSFLEERQGNQGTDTLRWTEQSRTSAWVSGEKTLNFWCYLNNSKTRQEEYGYLWLWTHKYVYKIYFTRRLWAPCLMSPLGLEWQWGTDFLDNSLQYLVLGQCLPSSTQKIDWEQLKQKESYAANGIQ